MPVFDFSNDTSEIKEEVVCTYTTFSSNVDHATIECPILILSNNKKQWEHHSCGLTTGVGSATIPAAALSSVNLYLFSSIPLYYMLDAAKITFFS